MSSGFYQSIGDNTIDSILRKHLCSFFEAKEMESKYQIAKRSIYGTIAQSCKVDEKIAKECAAYAFLNRELHLLDQLEEELTPLLFETLAANESEQVSTISQQTQQNRTVFPGKTSGLTGPPKSIAANNSFSNYADTSVRTIPKTAVIQQQAMQLPKRSRLAEYDYGEEYGQNYGECEEDSESEDIDQETLDMLSL